MLRNPERGCANCATLHVWAINTSYTAYTDPVLRLPDRLRTKDTWRQFINTRAQNPPTAEAWTLDELDEGLARACDPWLLRTSRSQIRSLMRVPTLMLAGAAGDALPFHDRAAVVLALVR